MANHASAEKRNRQRLTKTARNRATKSALRSVLKAARTTITSTPDKGKEALVAASSALDRAASKGTIPARRASRVKGRMAAALARASKAAS
jgi:small subunit ribosomal protein S20